MALHRAAFMAGFHEKPSHTMHVFWIYPLTAVVAPAGEG
jgi:hypothetical protein